MDFQSGLKEAKDKVDMKYVMVNIVYENTLLYILVLRKKSFSCKWKEWRKNYVNRNDSGERVCVCGNDVVFLSHLISAFLETGDFNVLLVDWSPLTALPWYLYNLFYLFFKIIGNVFALCETIFLGWDNGVSFETVCSTLHFLLVKEWWQSNYLS